MSQTTTQEEIIVRINAFLAEEFEVDESAMVPSASLKEVLDLDSLDLVVVIESNFHFKVKPEDFTGILTFQNFYDYIISKVNTKAVV
jgi:acyl carrier protein